MGGKEKQGLESVHLIMNLGSASSPLAAFPCQTSVSLFV